MQYLITKNLFHEFKEPHAETITVAYIQQRF